MKIVFMGTPEFAVPTLEALYNAGHSIDLVISQEDSRRGRGKKLLPTEVKAKAIELGLQVYQPKNVNSEEAIERIKDCEPDFIVVVAYGQIIKKPILEIPKYDIINVHASLLPKYRGAAPIHWSIVNGETETGVTIMQVEEGLDTGDMILKESIKIGKDDDASIIHDKLSELGGKMINTAISGIVDGSLKREKQDDSLSSYASKINRDSGDIDWNKNAQDIKNLIRGFKPWPSAYTKYKDEIMKIHRANAIEKVYEGEIGEIVHITDKAIYVKALDSTVEILELQFPGNRKMSVEDYLRGNTMEKGVILKQSN